MDFETDPTDGMNDSPFAEGSLFEAFDPIPLEDWEEKITKDLKGKDYKERLAWNMEEDLKLLPFYRREDLEELAFTIAQPGTWPYVRGRSADATGWEICHPVYQPKPEDAATELEHAIRYQADAVSVTFRTESHQGRLGGNLTGTDLQSLEQFRKWVGDHRLDGKHLVVDSEMATPYWVALLSAAADEGITENQQRASLSFDPFTYTAFNGCEPLPMAEWHTVAAQTIRFADENLPNIRSLGVDAVDFHNAGASSTQELAYALAIGTEMMAQLTDAGLKPKQVASHIFFRLGIGSSYFPEIAKFRASRLLWATILGSFGLDEDEADAFRIHAITSRWNKALYDAHTNMLRTTTEAMSAAIGGCDLLVVEPYDAIFRHPDSFAHRIAINQQHLLKEESYLSSVADPAGGSYYIEKLTEQMAESAWEQFQEIEQQGGFLQAVESGFIKQSVARSRDTEMQRARIRKETIVGVNQYPDSEERVKPKVDQGETMVSIRESDWDDELDTDNLLPSLITAISDGASYGDLLPSLMKPGKMETDPLDRRRLAELFEQLRLATEAYEEAGHELPSIFLLSIGSRKMRSARANFAANLFGCAGYRIQSNRGFGSLEDAVDEMARHQPEIVVLCSSDPEYEDLTQQLNKTLSALDYRPIVILAGHPGDHRETYEQRGVDDFIYAGMDLLSLLERYHHTLGITEQ